MMLKWIQEEYECEVIALTVNIGQTADDLDAIKQKALKLGAKDAIVYDAKAEFAELCAEAVKANADYQGGLCARLPARPGDDIHSSPFSLPRSSAAR
jgi:argininosuccinate synthase